VLARGNDSLRNGGCQVGAQADNREDKIGLGQHGFEIGRGRRGLAAGRQRGLCGDSGIRVPEYHTRDLRQVLECRQQDAGVRVTEAEDRGFHAGSG
jgi:hypothetical protein